MQRVQYSTKDLSEASNSAFPNRMMNRGYRSSTLTETKTSEGSRSASQSLHQSQSQSVRSQHTAASQHRSGTTRSSNEEPATNFICSDAAESPSINSEEAGNSESGTPRIPLSFGSRHPSNEENSIQQQTVDRRAMRPQKLFSAESEGTPGSKDQGAFSRNRERIPTQRSSSLDRIQLGDAERKFQNFLKSEKGAPICEMESVKRELTLQRQQKQQIAEHLVNVQTAEECVKAKQEALKATEEGLLEDQEKIERREILLRDERAEVEKLRSELSLKEKDLEIERKRYKRELNKCELKAEAQKEEAARLQSQFEKLEKRESELIEGDRQIREARENLNIQQSELDALRLQIQEREVGLAESEIEVCIHDYKTRVLMMMDRYIEFQVEEREGKLSRWEEDLRLKEKTLEEQSRQIEELKIVSEKHDQALKKKSELLDSDLQQLQNQRRALDAEREALTSEIETWHAKREAEDFQKNEEYQKLEEFEAELDERVSRLRNSENEVAEKQADLTKREQHWTSLEEELRSRSEKIEEKRSEWHLSVMQDVVEQKEQLELMKWVIQFA
ncbi:trichohyalin-like [Condylostylus longicornis]|uniref:trichohyalin-like n=1 Tax=Condylostylus longicornis TaxID=2530218 RepID=UPI00244E120D|nr:trichohyalin-like [Condylostylus longicornis]